MKKNAFVSFKFTTGRRSRGASAKWNFRYICRMGKNNEEKKDLVTVFHGNMPECAKDNPQALWEASDEYERANGRVYTEMTVGFPRELKMQESIRLVQDFIKSEVGKAHAFTVAVHCPTALDGKSNPHAHIMLTERANDGVERSLEMFFSRANSRNPERGGARKDPDWNRQNKIPELRESWCRHVNQALERNHVDFRVDHRSLKEQGIDREPEPKLGSAEASLLRAGIITKKGAKVVQLREMRLRGQNVFIKRSTILNAVKQKKLSVYKEIDINERSQYAVGGYKSRTSNQILFNSTKDDFLKKRRGSLASRHSELTQNLSSLKLYEKELIVIGECTLEVVRGADWTQKESLVHPDVFDATIRHSNGRSKERSQEVELSIDNSIDKSK